MKKEGTHGYKRTLRFTRLAFNWVDPRSGFNRLVKLW